MLKILDGVEVYMHANSDVVTQMHETSRRWIASYGRSYTIRFQPWLKMSLHVISKDIAAWIHILVPVSSKKNEDSEEEEEDNDKGNDNDNDEDECDCTADCNEPDFYVVYETMEVTKSDISNFTLIMNNLPTERLRRYVVRTKLDLVVSLGGIVGLFLGASLISAVEIFVHSFIRVFTKTKPKCPAVHQVGEISVTKPNKKSHDNTNSYSQYINNSLFFKKEYRNATI
ncbi:hypothetical protein C0J52_10165 [Blattella germanica]|nr:hypothetical protein C0J52_10165 [Blattella germanica]